jgi:hypothetical protein
MKTLTENVKFSSAVTPTAGAAGTTAINGTTLDMAGFDRVTVYVRMGAITSGAVTSIKGQQGSASDLSDAADLTNTGQTIADTDDDKIFIFEAQPTERYFRLVVSRATQNAVVAEAHYMLHTAGNVPVTQGSNVTVERHFPTSEGTA